MRSTSASRHYLRNAALSALAAVISHWSSCLKLCLHALTRWIWKLIRVNKTFNIIWKNHIRGWIFSFTEMVYLVYSIMIKGRICIILIVIFTLYHVSFSFPFSLKSENRGSSCFSKNISTSSWRYGQLTIAQPIHRISSVIHVHNWPVVQNVWHCQKNNLKCVLKWITREEVVLQRGACIIKVRKCCADESPTPLGTEIGSRATRGSWDRKQYLIIMHSLIPCKCHALFINCLTRVCSLICLIRLGRIRGFWLARCNRPRLKFITVLSQRQKVM